MLNKNRWQEWVNMVIGLWLFVSPFLGFGHETGPAALNAYIFGTIIVVLSGSALIFSQIWEEWINMAIGIWLFISPFVLGFSVHHTLELNQMDVGVLLFGISLIAAVFHPPYEHSRNVEHSL